MFLRVVLVGMLVLLRSGVAGQALVLNGSFERLHDCPRYVGDIEYAQGWRNGGLTPDLFSTCTGRGDNGLHVPDTYVGARTPLDGDSYAGLVLFTEDEHVSKKEAFEIEESLWTRLTRPLTPGHTYRLSLWVALADSSHFITPYLTAVLGAAPFDKIATPTRGQGVVLPLGTPAPSGGWQRVEATFQATTAWQYLSLGLARSLFDLRQYRQALEHNRRLPLRAGAEQDCYYYLDHIELVKLD
jgi:hypothetical protein